LRIITALRDAGFVAYLAGGCVRDALLGRPPKDYDVATNATPKSVRELFGKRKTIAFGASFGVIGVLPLSHRAESAPAADAKESPTPYTEVATFRSDGYYSDGRRPDSVHFGDAEQDALRRDFTINGLFFDPQEREVIDYVGGRADLEAELLRTIGDPLERFGEDKLRMLRAVRFATTLGFRIDNNTVQAITEHAGDITVVSGERVGAEMRRIISSQHAATGLRHLIACGLHRAVLPEVESADLRRFESLIQHVPRKFPISLACLMLTLEDFEQPLRAITSRWKLSNEEHRQIDAALKYWPVVADAHRLPWSRVQRILIHRDTETILELAAAVVAADQADLDGIELSREALEWPPEKLNPPPLLSGNDLRELGIPEGPQYRTILDCLRVAQLDRKIVSREEAVAMVEERGRGGEGE
jgi:tRNA nucleotidyltransferase/poly(A) polymerase